MNASFAIEDTKPLASIEPLILRHGAFVIGLAYLRAALAKRKHPPDMDVTCLSDHMRRDIGLGPCLRGKRSYERLR